MKPPVYDELEVGDVVFEMKKEPNIDEVQLVKYAGASGDFNPLHTVDAVGKKAGFGGVIAHGMLVMGIAAQAICAWVPNHQLRNFQVRFSSVTRPGESLKVVGKVTDKRSEGDEHRVVCRIQVINAEGEVKLKGSFEAAC